MEHGYPKNSSQRHDMILLKRVTACPDKWSRSVENKLFRLQQEYDFCGHLEEKFIVETHELDNIMNDFLVVNEDIKMGSARSKAIQRQWTKLQDCQMSLQSSTEHLAKTRSLFDTQIRLAPSKEDVLEREEALGEFLMRTYELLEDYLFESEYDQQSKGGGSSLDDGVSQKEQQGKVPANHETHVPDVGKFKDEQEEKDTNAEESTTPSSAEDHDSENTGPREGKTADTTSSQMEEDDYRKMLSQNLFNSKESLVNLEKHWVFEYRRLRSKWNQNYKSIVGSYKTWEDALEEFTIAKQSFEDERYVFGKMMDVYQEMSRVERSED